MEYKSTSMTRPSPSDSSAPSTRVHSPDAAAMESSSEPRSATTPPTSQSDRASPRSPKLADQAANEDSGSTRLRPRRMRASIPAYAVNPPPPSSRAQKSATQRDLSISSDNALIKDEDRQESLSYSKKRDKARNVDRAVPGTPQEPKRPSRVQRKPSVQERMKKIAGKVTSVLGKRTREVLHVGKRNLKVKKATPKPSRILRELDMGKRGVLDEMDLDVEIAAPLPPRPAKRLKTTHAQIQEFPQPVITGPLQKTSDGKKVKKWLSEGLYVGQEIGAKITHEGSKSLKKKLPSSLLDENNTDILPAPRAKLMSLPLFNYLDSTRDFVIPYDIWAPSLRRGDEKPKDWKMLNRNRLVGEAKDLWETEDLLPASACVCKTPAPGELGCEDDCLNRVMQYECNEQNCRLPSNLCSNRAFAELHARKEKGGLYDVGVEVIRTNQCGFGVRSCRSFAPGQIIMEYTGEIICEAECQRRMREEYKDKQCYYLMELERNLVIDGTKGSMARFINHSCAPNCEVRMVKVNGAPRMAVFAGESGIMTGEELSYDYNFDNFGEHQQACHCGAKTCRGYLGKRLNAAEQKKQAKLAEERKRKAAEEMLKLAATEERKKKIQNSRGSNWRGWVAVDDADVKERLREEKRRKEEAELNSSRAQRMAARRVTIGGDVGSSSSRSKSATPATRTSPRKRVPSAPASASKFSEDLLRPQPGSGVVKRSVSAKYRRKTTDAVATPKARKSFVSLDVEDMLSDEIQIGKPSKSKSILSSVGDAVKNSLAGRSTTGLIATANGKLKQTTLPFSRMG